jgi:hypothetical protein
MIPQLYRPTADEIAGVIARASARYADNQPVSDRLERAHKILADWTLYVQVAGKSLTWRVPSQSYADRHYCISTHPEANHCTCPDYERAAHLQIAAAIPADRTRIIGSSAGAPTIAGHIYCKHRLAIFGYLRILRKKMHADPATARMTSAQIITAADGQLAFASHRDAVKYSIFLHTFSLPTPPADSREPYPAGYIDWPPSGALTLPQMTSEEHRHWLATGETPAMRQTL